MPKCSFKNCKNHSSRTLKKDGVSYFRFPSNPFTCEKWISIVARERRDDFYKPAQNSVLCSDHFDKSEMVGNAHRRRLVKTAVPKLQIQPPLENPQLAAPRTKLSDSDIEVKPLSSFSGLDIKQEVTFNEELAERSSITSSPEASLSDLIPVSESPKIRFLNKQLLKARKIIDSKSKKIQALQKQNNRLVKRNSSLKNMVNLLKKKTNYRRERLDKLIHGMNAKKKKTA